ncbi:proton-conducting transporter transmembrane domain-containing protein [Candidatus Venteria ishoeyi]|nr:proton-conducting transporter membrane subunit [Candidatus Venteria ishoeyi]
MTESALWYYLIPLFPLLAASWLAISYLFFNNRGEAGEKHTARVASLASLASLLLLLAVDMLALWQGVPGQTQALTWFNAGDYHLSFSLRLDTLGLSIGTLVALIAFLTTRFSINYLHREAGFQRFFMVISLFTSAMLLIVLAGNALLAFIGWELAGVSSYLLIGYALDRPNATKNANRAFVTNRIGDAGFILAMAFSLLWWNSLEWPVILENAQQHSTLAVGVVALGFLLAALAKSALVPFSPWISRALEGPTPSSAIFYGSLMVHAGVYLVIRLQPLWEQVPLFMILLAVLGALTALYGFLSGLVQTDVKSSLMFSTTGQVGVMFLLCGLGYFTLAAWYLALHAIWRAYQFLHAPALMHLVSRPARPVPAWMQRCPKLYIAALQRFWLDSFADAVWVRPLSLMARDVQAFDDRIVNRMVGLPGATGVYPTLSGHQSDQRIGHARGMAGRLLQWVAAWSYWFEEQLILRGGGEGLLSVLNRLGKSFDKLDYLLSQPRYLLLMVVVTFAVIL